MDELTVISLISRGETEQVDFKKKLTFESADTKAEFIKDVISIANSVSASGYLLVGVDDKKIIVGTEELSEEQIQQIVHTYVTPPIKIQYFYIPISAPGFPSVSVIEIQPTTKPHKVSRAIDKLNKDDVFVRRGSVVFKASPDEIINMYQTIKSWTVDISEKEIRLDRVKKCEYSFDEREADLEWLKSNTSGYELGEVLYWDVEGWDSIDLEQVGKEALPLLNQAINLGYRIADVYFLRAEAHFACYNYGLALEDIDKAIQKVHRSDWELVEYISLKVNILQAMGKYEKIYEVVSNYENFIHRDDLRKYLNRHYKTDEEFICQTALNYAWSDRKLSQVEDVIINILLLEKARLITGWAYKNDHEPASFSTMIESIIDLFPNTMLVLHNAIGEAAWSKFYADERVNITFQFPSLSDQISKIK